MSLLNLRSKLTITESHRDSIREYWTWSGFESLDQATEFATEWSEYCGYMLSPDLDVKVGENGNAYIKASKYLKI